MGQVPKCVETEDCSLKRGITGDASPPRSCLAREAVLLSTLPQRYTCTARDSNPGPLASDASALTIRPTRAAWKSALTSDCHSFLNFRLIGQ